MKIICDQCQAKYSIKDERVRGKSLKVKCKKCGNVIEVSDTARKRSIGGDSKAPAPAQDQARAASSVLENRFAQSFKTADGMPVATAGTKGLFDAVKKSAIAIEQGEEAANIWFVAIDGNSVGPTSGTKVHSLRSAGKVNDDTLVWKEGMLDWTALRNCKDLVGLLAKIDLSNTLQEPAPPKAGSPKLGLFTEGEKGPSPLAGQSMGQVGDRTDAPARMPEEEPKKAAAPAPTWGEPMDEDTAFLSNTTITSISAPQLEGSGRRWKLLAAVGFFIASIAVLALVIMMGKNTPETIIKEKIVEKTQVIYKDKPIGADDELLTDEEEEDGGSGARRVKKRRGGGSSSVRKETAEERKRRLMSELGRGASNLRGGSSGGGSGDSLSQQQMSRVVGKNRGGLQLCYERAMKSGGAPTDRDLKVTFDVSVGTSGMVKSVGMSGSGAGYPELKGCLQSSVKKWMFPASGGSSNVQFPIVFTPAR